MGTTIRRAIFAVLAVVAVAMGFQETSTDPDAASRRAKPAGTLYSAAMLQALLVTFREGIEAFLIVGVISAYLRKTNRAGLLRGVRVGLAVSAVTCVLGPWLWQQVPNQALYEGVGAL